MLVAACFAVSAQSDTGSKKTVLQPAAGPNTPAKEITANAGVPVIAFENTIYDFNAIDPKAEVFCEFKFTNKGTGLLVIKDVQSTCGCTVPNLDKKEYAPSESGAIKVKYTAGAYLGRVTKQVFVNSNDAKEPRLALTIKANVVKKVEIKPDPILLSLKKPNAGCPDITVSSLDGKVFAVTGVRSSPVGCMSIVFDPNVRADKFVFSPKVDLQKLGKASRGTIHIALNHPEYKEVTALFDSPSLYRTTSPSLLLLNTEPGKTVTRDKIWVLSNYNEDFEIESTSSQANYIKASSVEKVSPGRYSLTLQITPPPLPSDSSKPANSFIDTFVIKIKGGEQVEISCRGYYTKPKAATAQK